MSSGMNTYGNPLSSQSGGNGQQGGYGMQSTGMNGQQQYNPNMMNNGGRNMNSSNPGMMNGYGQQQSTPSDNGYDQPMSYDGYEMSASGDQQDYIGMWFFDENKKIFNLKNKNVCSMLTQNDLKHSVFCRKTKKTHFYVFYVIENPNCKQAHDLMFPHNNDRNRCDIA
jgi:hypothetical protein